MKAQRFSFTLPDDLAQEFKRLVPKGKRSQFIAEAIREKLYKKNL